ncbi:MAG: sulfur carrier protein ThiS [Firmicutes bacterium]|nr:sulfur carrier protein ThiS [Bacillota bacterium]
MLVSVNGKREDVPEGLTLTEFITQKKVDAGTVIVEYNGVLVKQEEWPGIVLKENDRLEILRFVGGG